MKKNCLMCEILTQQLILNLRLIYLTFFLISCCLTESFGQYQPSIKNSITTCQSLICFTKNKLEIPIDVIKNKTVIDSLYLIEERTPGDTIHISFSGDTIYNINDNYSALIVDYNDGLVCTYKFILIINLKTNINTDHIIGYTSCDRDGERKFYSYDFLIKNNKITIFDKETPEGTDDSKIIETNYYIVDNLGKLKKQK